VVGETGRRAEGDTHDSRLGVNGSAQRVDGDDVRCLLVPRAILLPVAGRDFFPRVVEVDRLLEVLHGDGGEVVVVGCMPGIRFRGRAGRVRLAMDMDRGLMRRRKGECSGRGMSNKQRFTAGL
jgi:hypothetical protein